MTNKSLFTCSLAHINPLENMTRDSNCDSSYGTWVRSFQLCTIASDLVELLTKVPFYHASSNVSSSICLRQGKLHSNISPHCSYQIFSFKFNISPKLIKILFCHPMCKNLSTMERSNACMSIIQRTNPKVCLLINTCGHFPRTTFNTFIPHPRLLILWQLDTISVIPWPSLIIKPCV